MGLDRDKLLEALRLSFAAELEEVLPKLEADLLALDRGGEAAEARTERVHRVFRHVHGLKGAARAASFGEAEALCHALEERFGRARETGEVPRELVRDALSALDALRGTVAAPQAPAEAQTPGSRPGEEEASASESERSPASAEARVERVRVDLLDRALAVSHELGVAHGRLDERLEVLAGAIGDVGDLEARTGEGDRVDLERRLGALERRLRRLHFELRQDRRLFEGLGDALEDELSRSRRVPFSAACQGLERVVWDVAAARGRRARIALHDQELELDREVADRLHGALLQLVRNAVDHGLEAPAERAAAGKSEEGVVTLRAAMEGAEIRVTVEDDGRGLDESALLAAARAKGLAPVGGATPEDQSEIWRLAFRPGLSTAREVSDVSGRGVGLDVVRDRVEAMHGQLRVHSERGRGVRFTLLLPVSLSARRALVLRVAGQELGVLTSHVRRVHRIDPRRVANRGGRTVFLRSASQAEADADAGGEAPVPLGDLARAVGLIGGEGAAHKAAPGARARLLELRTDEGEAAVRVDEVVGEEEVLVKGFGPQVKRLRSWGGLGVRPGGRLLALVSADRLVRAARRGEGGPVALPRTDGAAEGDGNGEKRRLRVLVADDSLTTRTLERSILEAAGYEVTVASDGAEAWRLLQERGADVLVSDVEMPELDGFGLTRTVRGSQRFGELPVVLVTALASEEDRRHGMEAGADAYLVKSAFDQTLLLRTLEELLGRPR